MSDAPQAQPQSAALPVDDPQPVIRTFASDMAALQAAGKPSDVAPSTPMPAPAPAPKPEPVRPATPPPAPASTPAAPAAPTSVNVLSSDAARNDVLARLRSRVSGSSPMAQAPAAPVAAPLPKAPGYSRFSSIPGNFDSAPIAPTAPDSAIPAVLTQKPASPPPPPKPIPAPAPTMPAWKPWPKAPDAPNPAAAPAPNPVPPPTPAQAPAPTFVRPNPFPAITDRVAPTPPVNSPLHTYTGDFAERIETKNASAFSVLAAEKDAGRVPTRAPKQSVTPRIVLAAVGGIVLILGGGAGIWYALTIARATAPVAVTPVASSLIAVDDRTAITGSTDELRGALVEAAEKPLSDGQARLIYLTIATTTPTGPVNLPQPGGTLIDALKLPAPDIFLRHILPESMIGAVHAGTETRPFFILSVDSYDRTFAGMLQWEPTIGRDLATFYPAYSAAVPVASTTASTTATQPSVPAPSVPFVPQFKDEIVANHDARVLKDAAGNTVLLYGYRDQNTLVIARDEAAFTELLRRLAAAR